MFNIYTYKIAFPLDEKINKTAVCFDCIQENSVTALPLPHRLPGQVHVFQTRLSLHKDAFQWVSAHVTGREQEVLWHKAQHRSSGSRAREV